MVKIVPVDGQRLVNDQPQTKLTDMLAEIIISTELSDLSKSSSLAPGFLNVRRCNLIHGNYPQILLEKWDAYKAEKGSDNERPDFFDAAAMQKFVVLEMSNGGVDLENVVLSSAAVGWAIFQQVSHALAVAEQTHQFEHRDLHWGNILVRDTREKSLLYSLENEKFEVETLGKCATIIDFSLSRLTVPGQEGCDIFNNLAEDPELFTSEGDYQFDIYRYIFF